MKFLDFFIEPLHNCALSLALTRAMPQSQSDGDFILLPEPPGAPPSRDLSQDDAAQISDGSSSIMSFQGQMYNVEEPIDTNGSKPASHTPGELAHASLQTQQQEGDDCLAAHAGISLVSRASAVSAKPNSMANCRKSTPPCRIFVAPPAGTAPSRGGRVPSSLNTPIPAKVTKSNFTFFGFPSTGRAQTWQAHQRPFPMFLMCIYLLMLLCIEFAVGFMTCVRNLWKCCVSCPLSAFMTSCRCMYDQVCMQA
jgi:hypothetical protein